MGQPSGSSLPVAGYGERGQAYARMIDDKMQVFFFGPVLAVFLLTEGAKDCLSEVGSTRWCKEWCTLPCWHGRSSP